MTFFHIVIFIIWYKRFKGGRRLFFFFLSNQEGGNDETAVYIVYKRIVALKMSFKHEQETREYTGA